MSNHTFIIKSGPGYFIRFLNDTPEMTTDPVEATRMREDEAVSIVAKMDKLGLNAELVNVRIGKYPTT